jgi:plasmid stabilization system protein ParE
MKRVVIAAIARKELEEGLLFYAQRSTQVAEQFLHDFEKALQLVASFPSGWPPYLDQTRHCKLSRFPHAIVYRIAKNKIRVIAVAHLQRRMGYWKSRP